MFHIKKLLVLICLSVCSIMASAQPFPLSEGPWYYDTYAPSSRIKVSIVARGIENPWGMAFLPSGNILVAQKSGGIRIIRNGSLDPAIVTGTPEVRVASSGGLMDVVLHPDLVRTESRHIAVEVRGELTRGMTVVDRRGRESLGEGIVQVALEVDAPRFKSAMLESLLAWAQAE